MKKGKKKKKLGGGLGSGWPGLVGPGEQPLAQLDQVGPGLASWDEFFVLSNKCSPSILLHFSIYYACSLSFAAWLVDLEGSAGDDASG